VKSPEAWMISSLKSSSLPVECVAELVLRMKEMMKNAVLSIEQQILLLRETETGQGEIYSLASDMEYYSLQIS
jgi:hypothetical protein